MRGPRTINGSLAIIIAGLVVFAATRFFVPSPVAHGAAETVTASSYQIPSSNWAYPHINLYGGGSSSGWPFVGNESDLQAADGAPLNPDVIADYARFPMIIIPITPSGDVRRDILAALRQQNPAQKVFAYVHSTGVWCPADSNNNIGYPDAAFYKQFYLDVTFGDPSCGSQSAGFLWLQNGMKAADGAATFGLSANLAHRIDLGGGNYRYDVAEAMATTTYTFAKKSKGYDGIFLDVFCPTVNWMEPTDPGHVYNDPTNFDYVKAGYGSVNNETSHDAFNLGWQAGHQAYAEKLRSLAIADGQPDYPISGNCAQAPTRLQPYLNGWMREGYPFQNSYAGTADFYSNMFAWPWGYMHQDYNFRTPQYNFIFPPAEPDYVSNGIPVYSPYNATNQRKLRFGLGSASLGDGSVEFHDGSGNPKMGLWYKWWYDEYSVRTDLPTGNAQYGTTVKDAQHVQWLGMPLGPAYAQRSSTFDTTPNLLSTNTGFETAGANPQTIPGWGVYNPNTAANSVQRDATEVGVGAASLKAVVTVPDSTYAYVLSAYAGAFPVSAYSQYTVTFLAKGSGNLPLTVTFGGGTSNAIQTVRIDDTWREYQAVIRSTTAAASTNVQFQFALQAGTYWIDDVHVQLGATGVWRRDFDHGIVLVNPTAVSQTVNLEKPYQRIRGTVNSTLNNGARVSQVVIPGTNSGSGIGDAAFLLNLDLTPPGQVGDLHVQ